MKMSARIDLQRFAFRLFLVWIFISAFYYAGNLIEGQVLVGRSEALFHKALKYVVALSLSVVFLLFHRETKLLLQYAGLAFVLCAMVIHSLLGFDVAFATDILIVLLSFIGLAYAAANFDEKQIASLVKATVISAVFVSSISYFEYYFMEPVLGDYWRNTGGFRSISTLLNPNNLGLFLGAAILMLLFGKEFAAPFKVIGFTIILGALLMTGSRTAWVSVTAAVTLGMLYRGNAKIHIWSFVNLGVLVPFILIAFAAVYSTGLFSLPERAVDMYTAALRLEKYFSYLLGVDITYLLPDFDLARIDVVSESAYFHFLNALGFVWAGIVAISLLAFFYSGWLRSLFTVSRYRCFDILVFYYCVAMAFENVLMSFPNNQLIFISFGITVLNARNRVPDRLGVSTPQLTRNFEG